MAARRKFPVQQEPDEVTVFEWIDLTRAEYYLAKNVFHEPGKEATNRKVDEKLVRKYASKMNRGVWHTTHQGIGITTNDEICDGQHTLLAIREAARTNPDIRIRIPVTTGLHPDTFKYVDRGRKRLIQDFLTARGLTNVNRLVAIARSVQAYYDIPYENPGSWKNDAFDEDLLEETLEKHPLIYTAVEVVSPAHKLCSIPALGTAYVLCHELRPDVEVEVFFHQVIKGENIGAGDPAYELRERLQSHKGGRSLIVRLEQLAFIIQAFNQFAKGARVKRGALRMTRFMAFPRIAGPDLSADEGEEEE